MNDDLFESGLRGSFACVAHQSRYRLEGYLDLANADRVVERLAQLAGDGRDLELDLSGVTFMDSSGLRALIKLDREFRRGKGRLRLIAASSVVRRVLEISGADRLFTDAGPPDDAPSR